MSLRILMVDSGLRKLFTAKQIISVTVVTGSEGGS